MKTFVNSSLLVVSLLLVSNLFFNSCDNGNDDSETVPIPLLANTLTFDNNGELEFSESYQYDNQGRIIKVDDNEGHYSTIEYSELTIIVKDYFEGKLEGTSIGQLNSKGLCTSITYDDSDDLESYEYDNNGYRKLSTDETDIYLHTTAYSVSDGNYMTIISEDQSKTQNSAHAKEVGLFKRSFLAANLQKRMTSKNWLKSTAQGNIYKTDYQFYKDKINTIEFENMGISFMGKQNKNPIKEEISTFTFEGDPSQIKTNTYTYEYYSKGRISKQVTDDGNYSIYTYVD